MKAPIITSLVSLLLAIPAYAATQIENGFKQVKQELGITLYERWIPHPSGENVREIKAIFTVAASAKEIKELLTDAKRGTKWNMNAKNYNTATLTDNTSVIYIRYDMPKPFEDRDCCLQYTFGKEENGSCEINFVTTQHEQFPIVDGVSRIKGTKGKWLLRNMGSGRTQVTYIITTDKSMKIPRWVSDPIVHNNLFKTMTAFKNILEKR